TEYLNKISSNLSALSALESDRTFDYQTYLGELDKLKTTLGNYQTQEATDYARYLDLWSQATQAEQLAREQKQREYDNALNLLQALGYATPEVAQTLGLNTDTAGTTNGAAVPNDSTVTAPVQNLGVKGYDNGDLKSNEIVEMQDALGLDTDGKWGPKSQAKALAEWGFRSADDAWEYYVNNIKNPDTSNFTVTNRNGNGWVAIGNSRMTWPELEKAVNLDKTIDEVIDWEKGTITYKYASTGKTK
ncbi:MAG: hypothetical protein IJN87_08590, partial [Firmicutes bacterium]|nr:hypothetical protein [Bacillota bacterium]